jgi:hypothetical protein
MIETTNKTIEGLLEELNKNNKEAFEECTV